MRMGNTFSRALDPSKPLLFGDHPLGILQEELWHPTAARLSWHDPLSGTTSDLNPGRSSPSCEADSQYPLKQAMTDHPGVCDSSPACASTVSTSYQQCVASRLLDLSSTHTVAKSCTCLVWWVCCMVSMQWSTDETALVSTAE